MRLCLLVVRLIGGFCMKDDIKEYQDLAFKICDILDSNKGENILLIDVSKMTSVADYFVLVTATSKPHTKALMEKVEEELEKQDIRIIRRDGVGDGRWIVMDYGNIVIHIFTAELREFYHIEKIWTMGKNTMTLGDIQKVREREAKSKLDAAKKAEKQEAIAKAKLEREEKAKAKKETAKSAKAKDKTKASKVADDNDDAKV